MSSSKINVLLVGSGGREHALSWKLLSSHKLSKLYVAPGNGGTTEYNVPIKATDMASLASFAKEKNCFTIIGPEAPLELGLVDQLSALGLRSFGPSKDQAMLETSKAHAKNFMRDNVIPTARYEIFDSYDKALGYANDRLGDVVIKADGLAGGKGVFLSSTIEEAESVLKSILIDKKLGTAGSSVIIEEKLKGREVSFMALADGRDAMMFGTAVDHKRLLEGNRGPNTGGMGSYSPAIDFDEALTEEVMERIIRPTIKKSGFKGFLYAGLMLTEEGPKVLEFNARLGDPETQCLLPRLKADLLNILLEVDRYGIEGSKTTPDWSKSFSCCVVMCSRGYPANVETGLRISGLEDASKLDDTLIFHAATTRDLYGETFTSGGRAICSCGIASNLDDAAQKAYSAVSLISWEGEFHRNDIGRQI